MTSHVRTSFGSATMLGTTASPSPTSHTMRSMPGHASPRCARRHIARTAPPRVVTAIGMLTTSMAWISPRTNAPLATTVAPRSAVHRGAPPSGAGRGGPRQGAAPRERRARASPRAARRGRGRRPAMRPPPRPAVPGRRTRPRPEASPGRTLPLRCGSAIRGGSRRPRRTPHRRAAAARWVSRDGRAHDRLPHAIAEAASATIAPASAAMRTPRRGVHASTMATRRMPERPPYLGRAIPPVLWRAGATSPSTSPRVTAIVASADRRSQVSAAAKTISPTAGAARTPLSRTNPIGGARTRARGQRLRTQATRAACAERGRRDARRAGVRDAVLLEQGDTGPAPRHRAAGEAECDQREHRPAEIGGHPRSRDRHRRQRPQVHGPPGQPWNRTPEAGHPRLAADPSGRRQEEDRRIRVRRCRARGTRGPESAHRPRPRRSTHRRRSR